MATDPPSTAGGYDEPAVMAVVGIEIVREGEGGGCCRAIGPAVLQDRWYCSRDGGYEGERAAARVGGAGNAGRWASPTAGKREGISL